MRKPLRWGTPVAVTVGALFVGPTALAGTGWMVASTPPTNTNAVIYAAWALTNNDAWAVGNAFGGAGTASPPPISYHWNGSAWSMVPTANVNGTVAGLFGVSSSSATDAWAVGFTRAGGYRGNNSLFEHWNGTTWSATTGVNLGRMAGVADLSPTNAWAVSTNGMVEHWDGGAWTAVTIPQPNPSNTVGNRVTSVSSSGPDIWAVGTYTTPSYTDDIYSLHYDGTAWSVVAMAKPANGSPTVSAMTVLSGTNAWAFGQSGGTALVEHWDGVSWTFMPPVQGVTYPTFTAAAARSANDLWAFGTQYHGTQASNLLLHWDGSRWSSTASTPVPASLYAAAANAGGSRVWALGVGATARPLILSHS